MSQQNHGPGSYEVWLWPAGMPAVQKRHMQVYADSEPAVTFTVKMMADLSDPSADKASLLFAR